MNYGGLNEAALKAEIQKDFFSDYNYTVELERVDFVIAAHNVESKNAILFSEEALLKSILWAEAKQGTTHEKRAGSVFDVVLLRNAGKRATGFYRA